ncbi:hypothetical protein PTSG_00164 [Salpingoeca rosetta]|uniref:Uncharacterized protein n=1 Tax=Salpingoeca rosetta (strain ATCC 50818 / BSB-021) TaxID=946362 RepID=F2TVP8_SALR5|nr:uncharacterized protein PTSG_00164 [Salpingoeca rosetta]EGD72144.1 hypothetical protein PTSG_00164 [Salpingoeca rosetta]|eukprot:XP_004998716.1 hypothetical protein PTSG_00164 [Salpingoeca rosetta]
MRSRALLDSYTSLQLAFSTNVWANVVSAGLGSAHDAQQQQSHHDAALPAARSREMDSSTQRPAYVAISEDDFDEWCGTLLEEMDQSVQDVPIERAIILCYEDTIARASHQQHHQQQHHLPRHRTQTICAPAPRMISGTVDNPYLAQLLAALRHMWPRECTANKRGRPPAALTAPTVPLDGSWWGRKTGEGVGPHIHVKRSHLQAVPILSSDVAGRDDGGRSGGSGGGGGGGDEHRDPAGRCEGACQPSGISANHPLRRRQLYIGEARDAPVLRASILNSG